MASEIISLEVLSPKGKMEIDASDITELRNQIAQQLLQTEPGNVKLMAYGRVAPDEGSLSDFLQKSPIQREGRRQVFAICEEQQQQPSAPTPAPESQAQVLDLMPEHIREDLLAGSTCFVDLTRSWELQFQENPETTRLHLKSPQTRELLESMRVPGRTNTGAMQSNGAIDIEALLTPSQKFLQGGTGSSGPLGIQRDIQFYNQILADSLKPLMQQPTLAGFGVREPQRTSVHSASGDRPTQSAGNLLERASNNPEAMEAFKKAQESLRVLRSLAPELLPELRQELGLIEKTESPHLGIETTPPLLRDLGLLQAGGSDPTDASLFGILDSLATQGADDEGADDAAATDEALAKKYSVQLLHLIDMGFTVKEANLRALQKTRGNLDAAIEMLDK